MCSHLQERAEHDEAEVVERPHRGVPDVLVGVHHGVAEPARPPRPALAHERPPRRRGLGVDPQVQVADAEAEGEGDAAGLQILSREPHGVVGQHPPQRHGGAAVAGAGRQPRPQAAAAHRHAVLERLDSLHQTTGPLDPDAHRRVVDAEAGHLRHEWRGVVDRAGVGVHPERVGGGDAPRLEGVEDQRRGARHRQARPVDGPPLRLQFGGQRVHPLAAHVERHEHPLTVGGQVPPLVEVAPVPVDGDDDRVVVAAALAGAQHTPRRHGQDVLRIEQQQDHGDGQHDVHGGGTV